MATFDNLYRKCYNKCNDDNKNVISHQSPKFALYGVFAHQGIITPKSRKNGVQAIYIKFGNTKTAKMCAVQRQRKKAYLYIQKRHFVKSLSCGYKMVTVIRCRLTARRRLWQNRHNGRRSVPAAEKLAGCQKLAVRTLTIEY